MKRSRNTDNDQVMRNKRSSLKHWAGRPVWTNTHLGLVCCFTKTQLLAFVYTRVKKR